MTASIDQLNLQEHIGGGEIYTAFVTRALRELGMAGRLFVNPRARFWHDLDLGAVEICPLDSIEGLSGELSPATGALLTHTVLPETAARLLAHTTRLAGMLHMPLYDRFPAGLPFYHRLWAVSGHVIASAHHRGLSNVYTEPLWGVADLRPRGRAEPPCARSPYDWDTRKFRDRVLGVLESAVPRLFSGPARGYRKKSDVITLAIVSRLTPIKQFPLMFSILAPIIAQCPRVRLEIFGGGGYASVRDLRRALRPCEAQVHFWGQQSDVAAVYREVDYVLSGLPEKEALGLNLIEAQQCETPVLAVNKPPFTETVVDGVTGFLYPDPREDGGQGFRELLRRLGQARSPNDRILKDVTMAREHLARFSPDAFRLRLARAIEDVML